jgi:DNA polymerase III delta prime subunit
MAYTKDLKTVFSRLIRRDKLSHGVLFFGESLQAQFMFTLSLARVLETKNWNANEPLLDCLVFDETSASGINAAREMNAFLWKKSFRSERRTLIFHRADRLTMHAQNAILKLAEDPPAESLIILTSKNPDVLLPALQSRFQKIFISDIYSCEDEFSGEQKEEMQRRAETYARRLGTAVNGKERTEVIKELITEENQSVLHGCIAMILNSLHEKPRENVVLMKQVVHRWRLMQEYNTNKKLQLEAMFSGL